MTKYILILFSCFLFTDGFSQVDKINVKKEVKSSNFKNDTCEFIVNIEKSMYGKHLVLQSIKLFGDNDQQKVMRSLPFRKFQAYLEQKHHLQDITIQAMCVELCKIGKYHLSSVEVKEHKTTNEKYKNRFDIYLTYAN